MQLTWFAKSKALSLFDDVNKIDPKYVARSLWAGNYEQVPRIEMDVQHDMGLNLISYCINRSQHMC